MEYETIGVIVIIIGFISVQIESVRRSDKKEHDKMWKVVKKIALKVGCPKDEVDLYGD